MLEKKGVFIYIGILCIALAAVLFGAYHFFFGHVQPDDTMQSLASAQASGSAERSAPYDCVALFGIDTQQGTQGRADAILLASIDREKNAIKLCSIARDTKAEIANHGTHKLNAAFAYGGGDLMLQTINENFNLHVTSYIAVNFSEMADIVDQLGGVEVELSDGERQALGALADGLTTGSQVHLNGAQAVAYSRIRHLDNDDVRTSRQREVLSSLLERVRSMDADTYPDVMDQLLRTCTSNLSQSDLMALLAQFTPRDTTISQYAIPSANTKAEGKTIDGAWYYVYDTQKAGKEILPISGFSLPILSVSYPFISSSAIASICASFAAFIADLMVTVVSSHVMFLLFSNADLIMRPAVGAQVPFSITPRVRF